MIDIPLAEITLPEKRLRTLRPDVVTSLADSIRAQGLLHPILLRKQGSALVLVVGMHRLEAFRKLGRETIPAELREGLDAVKAELAEIDENLMRAELSTAERDLHLLRRKVLYERLHPHTQHGGDRRSDKFSSRQFGDLNGEHSTAAAADETGQAETEQGTAGEAPGNVVQLEQPAAERFTKAAAQKTGQSERTVQRSVDRADALGEDVLRQVAGTVLDKPEQLNALAAMDHQMMDEVIERVRAGENVNAKAELKKHKRAEREIDLAAKILTLPDKKFGVIVEDLEWDFSVWSRETGMDRHAANHYPVAENAHSAAELHERTKDRLANAADDCVLWMWTTVPHLKLALELMELRGFKYVSNYVWGKDRVGTGFWSRNKHEHLLIGTRGNVVAPAPGTQWDSLIEAPVGEHSAKPERFLEMIEAYYPTIPKLELNRRGPPRPGWHAWGNEAEPEPEAAE